jgi:5-methylcytosine-specific restriction endonuclease McrA
LTSGARRGGSAPGGLDLGAPEVCAYCGAPACGSVEAIHWLTPGAAELEARGQRYVPVCRSSRYEPCGKRRRQLYRRAGIPPEIQKQRNWVSSRRKRLLVELAERDGPGCTWCGDTERLQIDHVVPVSDGGGNELANLRLACGDCNASRGTAATPRFFSQAPAPRGRLWARRVRYDSYHNGRRRLGRDEHERVRARLLARESKVGARRMF